MAAMAERVVIIPIDGSDGAEWAFDYYKEHIHQKADKVICLHTQEPVDVPLAGAIIAGDYKKQLDEKDKEIKKLEAKYVEKLKALHENEPEHVPAKIKVVAGKPGEQIVSHSKEENAAMVVIGSRGLGTIRRTFLGSVSDYVIHHSHLPVLVVPPKKNNSIANAVVGSINFLYLFNLCVSNGSVANTDFEL